MSRTASGGKPLIARLMLVIATGGYLVVSHFAQGADIAALDRPPYANNTETTPRIGNLILATSSTNAFSAPTATFIKSDNTNVELLSQQNREDDRRAAEALEAMHAYNTTRGALLILPKLLFQSKGSRLGPMTLRELEPLVQFLTEHPERRVEIDGFTDGIGSIESNRALSQRRAETIKFTLVSRGVDAARISAYGFGIQACVASNASAEGRRQNRRIEIFISNRDGAISGWSDL